MAPQFVPAMIAIRKIRLTNLAMEDALNALHASTVNRVAARDSGDLADRQAMDGIFPGGIGVKLAGELLQQLVGGNVNGTERFPRQESIRLAQAGALLVGMGAPRQEHWMQAHAAAAASGASVVMGVGGLLDYYTGNIPRSPLWMRRNGLEWLFRLLQESRRLARRYLVGNWVFVMRVMGDRLRGNIRDKS